MMAEQIVVGRIVHRFAVEHACHARGPLPSSLLYDCAGSFLGCHGLLLGLLEHLNTFPIASGINQMKVRSITFRVEHDSGTDVREASGFTDASTVLLNDDIVPVEPLRSLDALFDTTTSK